MDNLDWFRDSVIYHILIDRFAGFKSTFDWDKPIFLGGNIKGIIDKLHYLKDLGINTIWISPFYQTSSYHGYHITDFYNVDPHFGDLNDIKNLVNEVHNQEMHIITDFVPNHCSKEHRFFKEAQSDRFSKYCDWFYFKNWPDDYLCFLSIKDLPKLNLNNPETKKYIIDAAKYWLSLNFDGFRLDHVIGPSHSFWMEFKNEIKKNYPNVVLIGEAWMMGIKRKELETINIKNKLLKSFLGLTTDKLLKEYVGELDGVLDFVFQEMIRKAIYNNKMTMKKLLKNLDKHYNEFPREYILPTFLDNHDMDRYLFYCKNRKDILKMMAKFQFSINQPPIIYYGTETGISQEKSIWDQKSHGDIQARMPMNWNSIDYDLFEFYKSLIRSKTNNICKT